jgi:hypothetical protein
MGYFLSGGGERVDIGQKYKRATALVANYQNIIKKLPCTPLI